MPFIIPFSVKAAITVGALVGATVAVVSNKEKLLEATEYYLQQGAQYCRQKLDEEKNKMKFASEYDDNELSEAHGGDYEKYDHDHTDFESMATTPDSSDTEMEFELLNSLD